LYSRAEDVQVELTPQIGLAGRVIDDQGDPIQNAQVSLLTSGIFEGRRTVLGSAEQVQTISSKTGSPGSPRGRPDRRLQGLRLGRQRQSRGCESRLDAALRKTVAVSIAPRQPAQVKLTRQIAPE
jgi:hypothetical protein